MERALFVAALLWAEYKHCFKRWFAFGIGTALGALGALAVFKYIFTVE